MMDEVKDENQAAGSENNVYQKSPVLNIFEDELQAEIFNARCHDINEPVNIEKARVFKEEFMRVNNIKNDKILNLFSMRLGVNSIISLSNAIQNRTIEHINLADNSISDYGMHAIKSILSNSQITFLNLSSNMISEAGLEMIIDDLIKNVTLKTLDLGVLEGSIRKNSIGTDGAKCIAAILLHNKYLESLRLQDNDIGTQGGEIIGAALKQNRVLKHLKLAENDLRTEGAEFIIKNSYNLENLELGKNFITSKIGPVLKEFMDDSTKLKRLNMEYNELFASGIEYIAQGMRGAKRLISLNIKGNAIRDEGLDMLSEAILQCPSLQELDISVNEITPIGISSLADVLPKSNIRVLNVAKNLLGDDSLIFIADKMNKYEEMCKLKTIDISASRVGDNGIIYFLEKTQNLVSLQYVKAQNNFISEKIEKIIIDLLDKNKNLTQFSLQGNRLSVCCLNKIKKILQRNQKQLEDKEPNKLKTEIYRLKHEQKKIMLAKDKLKQQENEIQRLEDMRTNLSNDLERLKVAENNRRESILLKIEEQKTQIDKKKQQIKQKTEEYKETVDKHEKELQKLNDEYNTVEVQKVNLEKEVARLNQEIEDQESRFQEEIQDHMDNIEKMKAKSIALEEQTQKLNDEYRELMSMEEAEKQKENEGKDLQSPKPTKLQLSRKKTLQVDSNQQATGGAEQAKIQIDKAIEEEKKADLVKEDVQSSAPVKKTTKKEGKNTKKQ